MTAAQAVDAALVDLLHPDGCATRVAVLGAACPPYLCAPARRIHDGTGPADAVLIVPTRHECQTSGWLEDAAAVTDRILAADGIAYVIVARRWRHRAVQLLGARGLTVATALAHVRQGGSSDLLIPCDADVARYAGLSAPTNRNRSRLWRVGWAVPGASSIVPRIAGDVGLLAHRPGGRPYTEWIEKRCGDGNRVANTLIRIKARGESITAVMSAFGPAAATPHTILKVPLSEASAGARRAEALALEQLGPAALTAGAAVPVARLLAVPGRADVLRLDAIAGTPLAALLVAQPHRAALAIERIAQWLERWSRATRRERAFDRSRMDSEIFGPAAAIAPLLDGGGVYLAWLRAAGERCLGSSLPTVATHGDLSMSNVLSGDDGRLGVIDWEHARADGLPLTDFFYSAVDAVAAANGYRDRAGAFVGCLDTTAPEGRLLTVSARRLASALGVADDAIELLRHATVLHHAANELKSGRMRDRPFVAMAQHLCSRALEHSPAA